MARLGKDKAQTTSVDPDTQGSSVGQVGHVSWLKSLMFWYMVLKLALIFSNWEFRARQSPKGLKRNLVFLTVLQYRQPYQKVWFTCGSLCVLRLCHCLKPIELRLKASKWQNTEVFDYLLYSSCSSLLSRHCLSLSGLQLRPVVTIFCPVYSISCVVDLVLQQPLMGYLAISLSRYLLSRGALLSTLKGSVATSQVTWPVCTWSPPICT